MEDQNTPDDSTPTTPLGNAGEFPWSVPAEQPYLPPVPAPVPAPARRGLTAAVLVGALVLGGAAGVAGAAGYDAWQGDDAPAGTVTKNDPIAATNTALVPDGSIEKVAAAVLPSVVKINVAGSSGAGSGSGIVLSADGNILTNNHVVSTAGQNGSITVTFNDGTTVKATIVGTDPVTDMPWSRPPGSPTSPPPRSDGPTI